MSRLLNSHLQAYSSQVKSQNAVHTLGSHWVYISEINLLLAKIETAIPTES